MCQFVPGQAIAIAPLSALEDIGQGLPGEIEVRPIVTRIGEFDEEMELARLGTIVLRTDPGLELFALSRLSARLSRWVEKGEAIVDLNHIIPLSMSPSSTELSNRLSPYAEKKVAAVRQLLRAALPPSSTPRRVAVLDSGLSPSYNPHRTLKYFDYSAGGKLVLDQQPDDPLGHGTRVVGILDQVLPPSVELLVGRLPSDPARMTALTVAHAFGDIVARGGPEVVNLSLAPRNDVFVCPACRQRVPTPTFLASFFPLLVRLGGRTQSKTVTVMASGNAGQIPNSRWLTEDVETLLFAVAENRKGERTKYSGAPEGPQADLFSASAFGGDDPDDEDAQGVFLDGPHTYGTSFAAPFLSALVLVTKQFNPPFIAGMPSQLGNHTRQLMTHIRGGGGLQFP